MDLVVSTLISVPVGILSSFLFWWWLDRRLAPRVAWSPVLVTPPEWASTGTDDDQTRVKIVNLGRRDAIDLHVCAHLRIPRDDDRVGSPTYIVELPTSVEWLPRLRRGSYRYVRLRPDRIPESEHARLGAPEGGPTHDLVGFLASTPGAAVRLYVFAYDSLSGSRKMFVSPDYTADRSLRGAFDPGPSLAATPASDRRPDDPIRSTPDAAGAGGSAPASPDPDPGGG